MTGVQTCALPICVLAICLALACVGLNVDWIRAQTPIQPGARPAFGVASVKRDKSEQRLGIGFQPSGRFSARSATLQRLMQLAYQRRTFDVRQIWGGPDWIATDSYEVEAKTDVGLAALFADDSPGLRHLMLRTLLEDRFKLVVHTETRQLPEIGRAHV